MLVVRPLAVVEDDIGVSAALNSSISDLIWRSYSLLGSANRASTTLGILASVEQLIEDFVAAVDAARSMT